MGSIRTNRDLYLALADLVAKTDASDRSLEEYLRALWGLARAYRDRPALTGDELLGLLARAFTGSAPPFDEGWRATYERDFPAAFRDFLGAFGAWEARVLRQIVDLREMDERGQLKDDQCYFGIDSPRGSRWYNFDPAAFLECAAAGTFGGWEEGDDTGRAYVPGLGAIVGGQVTPEPLLAISWDHFIMFLGNGQWYE